MCARNFPSCREDIVVLFRWGGRRRLHSPSGLLQRDNVAQFFGEVAGFIKLSVVVGIATLLSPDGDGSLQQTIVFYSGKVAATIIVW